MGLLCQRHTSFYDDDIAVLVEDDNAGHEELVGVGFNLELLLGTGKVAHPGMII